MPVSIEDLDRRVTALEARVRATETDRSTVNDKLNGLLGSQEVIIGTLRDQGRLLATHGAKLAEHDARFDRIDEKFVGIDEKFVGIDEKFVGIDGQLAQITGQLGLVVDWIQNQP